MYLPLSCSTHNTPYPQNPPISNDKVPMSQRDRLAQTRSWETAMLALHTVPKEPGSVQWSMQEAQYRKTVTTLENEKSLGMC